MNNVFVAGFCALMLAGCGDAGAPKQVDTKATIAPNATSETVPATNSTNDKVVIKFADGTGIAFDGKISRDAIVENKHGKSQRYVIELSAEARAIENAVFNVMVKAGYSRHVRQDEAGLYGVRYSKKGFPMITAVYKDFSKEEQGDVRKTTLVLSWRI